MEAKANIKLYYWNSYVRQTPLTWTADSNLNKFYKPSSLIRVVGHAHTLETLKWIFQIAVDYLDHKFLVYSNNVRSFSDLQFPNNVLPILQVDNENSYRYQIDEYLELCKDRSISIPTVSVFCANAFQISDKVKWLLFTGSHFHNMLKNINLNKHIPIYVERYRHGRALPKELNTRQCPSMLEVDLMPMWSQQCLGSYNLMGA